MKQFPITVGVIYHQILVILLVFCLGTLPATALNFYPVETIYNKDTVFVAPPTGDREIDRASIIAAIAQVKPGNVILFGSGMYRIGPIIRVDVPDITLLGHPKGTIIRGCDPEEFVDYQKAAFACNGLELSAARQTVRNLTIEYAWHGLYVGCCWPKSIEDMMAGEVPAKTQPGGHIIENNTFRYTPNGLRVIGEGAETTVVRNNRFIDVYHAIGINGGPVHFLDNEMKVENPERVPFSHHPGDVINITTYSSLLGNKDKSIIDHTSCQNNIIEGNRIEGYPDGIRVVVFTPNSSCQNNVIRDNIIIIERTRFTENWHGIRQSNKEDSTVIGIPLRLSILSETDTSKNSFPKNSFISNNIITGNKIIGAEGIGMKILYASGNQIKDNIFIDIRKREPFPGNTLGGDPERWEKANGSGIWLSPGSNGNEITGNIFGNIASTTVFIEGDNNQVKVRSVDDVVRDLGTGNRHRGIDIAGANGRSLPQTDSDLHNSKFQTDTIKVLAAANTFLKAFNNLEWETFYNSFSPSATVFQPFGNPFRQNDREELAGFFRSFFSQIKSTTDGPPYLTITPQDLRIQMIDEAAVVTFHLPGNNVGRRTLVFSRNGPDDAWQIAHLHASSLEEPGKNPTDKPVSQEFDLKMVHHYTGRYRLISEDMQLTVTIKAGERGLQAEIGDYKSELRYVGGHTFEEEKTGYLFVFNLITEGRATGITGISHELDRVEVFELIEEGDQDSKP